VAEITLRDVDNRDADGAPYEFTGSLDQVAAYLDGPLRSDLSDPEESAEDLDAAIAHVRGGRLASANLILKPMSIYLSTHPNDPESPTNNTNRSTN